MKNTELRFREKRTKENFFKLTKDFELDKNLRGKKKILDFGCGYGFFTKLLARRYPNKKIVGLEISKNKIKFAKKVNNSKNITYKLSKGIIGKYDVIIATFTIHEIKGAQTKLNHLEKSLNKNGVLLIYDFRKVSKNKFRKLYNKDMVHQGADFEEEYEEHNKWTLKEFKEMCEKAEFKTIKIKPSKQFYLVYIGIKK